MVTVNREGVWNPVNKLNRWMGMIVFLVIPTVLSY